MSEAVDQGAAKAANRERYARPLFALTIVTGSFLLFLTQPMIARMALPRLGGAPAVWNSAMLVYQALLLGGYAYAHWIAGIRPRAQAGVHLGLFALAALWLPIGLTSAMPSADVGPALWVPWFLLSSIGPLFFIISAQAPLMQRWYALETSRGEPYALYAASNLGSFAGLISYPLIVEPLLTLKQQSLFWTGGYALLVLLVACCALTIPAHKVEEAAVEKSPAPGRSRVLHWVALAAVPSGLMLSTSTHLTTDIVAMPLLWALPLGLYLLSFVVAFATRRAPSDFITRIAPFIILIAGGLAFSDGSAHPLFSATLGLLLLFVIAVALHGEMYRLRPAADRLTGFYLAMSVGGVLGGLFCALIAPTVFDWAYEHPLLIIGAALLVPQRPLFTWNERLEKLLPRVLPLVAIAISFAVDKELWTGISPLATVIGSVVIAVLALLMVGRRVAYAVTLAALMMSYGGWNTIQTSFGESRTRSYFGIYSVADNPANGVRMLSHGTTLHGLQSLQPGQETLPTSYYAPRSGVGLALGSAERLYGPGAHIGIVGLGTGTLGCYKKPGQDWRFFEIDPTVVGIARDSGYFSFIPRCAPDARIVIGDARLTLAMQPPGQFHMIAVDAFSSDAVPMHLLTREAFDVYGRALRRDGILLVHISNRYLDLRPVVAAAAQAGGWQASIFEYYPDEEAEAEDATVSIWIALSRDEMALLRMIVASGPDMVHWETLKPRPGFAGWTDDFASILPVLDIDLAEFKELLPGD